MMMLKYVGVASAGLVCLGMAAQPNRLHRRLTEVVTYETARAAHIKKVYGSLYHSTKGHGEEANTGVDREALQKLVGNVRDSNSSKLVHTSYSKGSIQDLKDKALVDKIFSSFDENGDGILSMEDGNSSVESMEDVESVMSSEFGNAYASFPEMRSNRSEEMIREAAAEYEAKELEKEITTAFDKFKGSDKEDTNINSMNESELSAAIANEHGSPPEESENYSELAAKWMSQYDVDNDNYLDSDEFTTLWKDTDGLQENMLWLTLLLSIGLPILSCVVGIILWKQKGICCKPEEEEESRLAELSSERIE